VLGVTGETYDTIDGTLPELDSEVFPLAAGIDRYGMTMFNAMQLNRLADEFERMLFGSPPRRAKLLRELIDLCRQGAQRSESELWIIGD